MTPLFPHISFLQMFQNRKRFLEDAETLKDRSLSAAEIKFATEFSVLKNTYERELDDLRCLLEGENKEVEREVHRVREELENLIEKNKENEEIIQKQKQIEKEKIKERDEVREKEKVKERDEVREKEEIIQKQKQIFLLEKEKVKERDEVREKEKSKEKEIEIELREEMHVALQALRCELVAKHAIEIHEKDLERDIAHRETISDNASAIRLLRDEYERDADSALKEQEEQLRREARGDGYSFAILLFET